MKNGNTGWYVNTVTNLSARETPCNELEISIAIKKYKL